MTTHGGPRSTVSSERRLWGAVLAQNFDREEIAHRSTVGGAQGPVA